MADSEPAHRAGAAGAACRARSGHGRTLLALAVCAVLHAPLAADLLAAQEGSLAGRLTDSATGLPIASAEVRVSGLEPVTLTNESGWFLVAALGTGKRAVEVRRVGYHPATLEVEIALNEMSTLDLKLVPAPLDVPGPTGIGRTTSATGAEVIDFAQHVAAGESAESLLRRVLGAQLYAGSGQPGEASSIRLRGPTSISGSQEPLIVIDGIIGRGGLSGISAADVARIEVYRGAAAAAEYGSRGQAGVVVVTTRRGGD